jgi:membrane protease YdiL (CAAX protease family)
MPETPARHPLGRLLLFWTAALAILMGSGLLKGFVPGRWGGLAWGVSSSIALLLLIRFLTTRDGGTLAAVGLRFTRGSPWRMAAGLVLGIGIYGVTLLAISLTLGPLQLVRAATPPLDVVLVIVASTVALAVMEELAFRSYSLWTARRAFGYWQTQAVVACAFGLLHLLYGWPLQTVAFGVVPSAVLFGVAAATTRGLAWPLGLHTGINLGRWLTGENGEHGLWRLSADGVDASRLALWSPWIGVGVLTAVACLFVRYGRGDRPFSPASRTSILRDDHPL